MENCKNCGFQLSVECIMPVEYSDSSGLELKQRVYGYCPKCFTKHTWINVYKKDRVEDLKEM